MGIDKNLKTRVSQEIASTQVSTTPVVQNQQQQTNAPSIGDALANPPKPKFSDKFQKLLYSNEFINLSFDEKVALLKKENPLWTDIEIRNVIMYVAPKNNTVDSDKSQRTDSSAKDVFDYDFLIENIDKVIPSKIINDEAWQMKSPMEKLEARINAYLSTYLGDYDPSDEQAQEQRKLLLSTIIDGKDFDKIPEKDWFTTQPELVQKSKMLELAMKLDIIESKDISFSKFLEMPEHKQREFNHKYENAILDEFIINNYESFNDRSYKNKKDPEAKLVAIYSEVLQKLDPSLSEEELESLAMMEVDKRITKALGKDQTPAERSEYMQLYINKIEMVVAYNKKHPESPFTLSEIDFVEIKSSKRSTSYTKQEIERQRNFEKVRYEYLKDQGLNTENDDVYHEYAQNTPEGELLTPAGLKKFLTEKKDSTQLTPAEESVLISLGEDVNNKPLALTSLHDIVGKGKVYETYEDYRSINEITTKENLYDHIRKNKIKIDKSDFLQLIKQGKIQGFTDDNGNPLSDEEILENLPDDIANILIQNAPNRVSRLETSNSVKVYNRKNLRSIGINQLALAGKDPEMPEELVKDGLNAAATGKYAKQNAEDLANACIKNGVSAEKVNWYTQIIFNNANISDEVKATFYNTTMAVAPNDEYRAAVSNGLTEMAASINASVANSSTSAQSAAGKGSSAHATASQATSASAHATNAAAQAQTPTPIPQVQSPQTTINPVSFTSQNLNNEIKQHIVDSVSARNDQVQNYNNDFWTKQAETKRQEAMANAADTTKSIKQKQADYEIRQKLNISEDEWNEIKAAIDEKEQDLKTNAGSGIDNSIRAQIHAELQSCSSIGEAYNILSKYLGSRFQERFINRLINSGSTERLNAFLNSHSTDTNFLTDIYEKTSSDAVRKAILSRLPQDTIAELLAAGKIKNLNDIDYKILMAYVRKNIYSMSNSEFAMYMQYLPYDAREILSKERNDARGISQKGSAVKGAAHSADMASPYIQTTNEQQGNNSFAQNQQNSNAQTQNQQPKPAKDQNSPFKNGEITTTLSDGRIITKEGTSFAAISNNEEETFRVVQPNKKKEGAPIGMDDEVLTPGSAEWNKKYNKNNVQSTAFTMAAMDEEDEDFGIPLGSNKVGMGKKINKKYKPHLGYKA